MSEPFSMFLARVWSVTRPRSQRVRLLALLLILAAIGRARCEPLGEYWGTAEEEAKYYKIVDIPVPNGMPMEAVSFDVLPDNRLAIGTRRGDIDLVTGAFDEHPKPS